MSASEQGGRPGDVGLTGVATTVALSSDPYARCRACGSRNVEGIADAHAFGPVGRNGMLRTVTQFAESFAQADPASLMCADCGSWNVRPPEALR